VSARTWGFKYPPDTLYTHARVASILVVQASATLGRSIAVH
jgi:hypothetical protein